MFLHKRHFVLINNCFLFYYSFAVVRHNLVKLTVIVVKKKHNHEILKLTSLFTSFTAKSLIAIYSTLAFFLT